MISERYPAKPAQPIGAVPAGPLHRTCIPRLLLSVSSNHNDDDKQTFRDARRESTCFTSMDSSIFISSPRRDYCIPINLALRDCRCSLLYHLRQSCGPPLTSNTHRRNNRLLASSKLLYIAAADQGSFFDLHSRSNDHQSSHWSTVETHSAAVQNCRAVPRRINQRALLHSKVESVILDRRKKISPSSAGFTTSLGPRSPPPPPPPAAVQGLFSALSLTYRDRRRLHSRFDPPCHSRFERPAVPGSPPRSITRINHPTPPRPSRRNQVRLGE